MDANEMTKIAEEQRRMAEQNAPAAMERDQKAREAQFASAEELSNLREDLARIERKQDKSSKESSKIGIATLVVTALGLAATIVFGMLQYLH